jgi:hypothetical protein
MQHSDSQRIDTSTLVFLKNPMCVRVRMGGKDGLVCSWFSLRLLFVLPLIDRVLLRVILPPITQIHADKRQTA